MFTYVSCRFDNGPCLHQQDPQPTRLLPAGGPEEAGAHGPPGSSGAKQHLVGSLQAGNGPQRNAIQKNLFLREFPAKNRKVRLKVTRGAREELHKGNSHGK